MIYRYGEFAPEIDPSAFVSESATIIGQVKIAADCFIGPGAVIRADCGKPIEIGYGTAVEDGVIIHVSGSRAVSCYIGERVTIGHGAIVHCSKLGDNANVGMGAVLSLFSEIGEYAVIAEGAVVKQGQVIEPRVVVGGAPARVLRPLLDRDIESWDRSKAWYIDLVRKYKTPGMLERID